MEVAAKVFQKQAVNLERTVSNSEGQGYSVWAVPAPLSAKKRVKDPCHLVGD